MRRFLGLMCLLLVGQLHAQSIMLNEKNPDGTPKWQAKWVEVPPPADTPIVGDIHGLPNPVVWGNTANPGGTFELSNILIDKQHRGGVWSIPATFTAGNGWTMRSDVRNQPPSLHSVGIGWKLKCLSLIPPAAPQGWTYEVGKEYMLCDNTGGVGPLQFNSPIPWTSSTPNMLSLTIHENFFPLNRLKSGGVHNVPAPAPVVEVASIPLRPMIFQYCYLTHTGETALSPPVQANPAAWCLPGTVGQIYVTRGSALPMGAICVHAYLDGKRLPAPHCLGTPTSPNDWAWPLEMYRMNITRMVEDGPAHVQAPQAKSYLNKLQVAMMETTRNIVVEDEEEIPLYCPIIDEWAMWPGTGGPNQFKFNRKIEHSTGAEWYIGQKRSFSVDGTTYTYPTYWSGLIVHNLKSVWNGLILNMYYGSTAMTYADYSGGQAFTNKFINCYFACYGWDDQTNQPKVPRLMTYGVRITPWSERAGHNASEQSYVNCSAAGTIAWAVEHAQSANVLWDRVWGISYDPVGCPPDRRAFSFWHNSPNPFRLAGGVFGECPTNVIFGLGWSPKLDVTDMWVDGGCISLVDVTSCQPGEIKFTRGKANLWTPAVGMGPPNLCRVYNTTELFSLSMLGTTFQLQPFDSEIHFTTMNVNKTDMWFENSPFLSHITFREPTPTEYYQSHAFYKSSPMTQPAANAPAAVIKAWNDYIKFINPPAPGRGFTIPSRTITVPASTLVINSVSHTIPAKTISLAAQEISLNSFQRPNNVRKKSWVSTITQTFTSAPLAPLSAP